MDHPILNTPRLHLRPLAETDIEEVYAIRSNDAVSRYLDRPVCTQLSEAAEFIQKIIALIEAEKSFYWAITKTNEPKMIGTICLWNFVPGKNLADIGYEMHPDSQGKGYTQEALSAVIDFSLKGLRLAAIEAEVHPQNIPSLHILEKFGFQRTLALENSIIYSLPNPSQSNRKK